MDVTIVFNHLIRIVPPPVQIHNGGFPSLYIDFDSKLLILKLIELPHNLKERISTNKFKYRFILIKALKFIIV